MFAIVNKDKYMVDQDAATYAPEPALLDKCEPNYVIMSQGLVVADKAIQKGYTVKHIDSAEGLTLDYDVFIADYETTKALQCIYGVSDE